MGVLDPRRNKELTKLVEKLGLTDLSKIDWVLLDLALIHSSISPQTNYEQLEFVGDSVVRLLASEILLETYPNSLVGEFAAIRSMLVSDRTLAEFAEIYGLERYLIMSDSAAADSGGKTSILADAFEAILGALYLSTKTMALIDPWLIPLLKEKAAEIRSDPALQNYKDALQAWSQAQYKILPKYKVQQNNQENKPEKRFIAEVWLKNELLGQGKGRSKKSAEQAAAKEAFLSLELHRFVKKYSATPTS